MVARVRQAATVGNIDFLRRIASKRQIESNTIALPKASSVIPTKAQPTPKMKMLKLSPGESQSKKQPKVVEESQTENQPKVAEAKAEHLV